MPLSLAAELLAAQNSQARKPLCRITSRASVADIPFNGNLLLDDSAIENDAIDPYVVRYSDGSLGIVYLITDIEDGNSAENLRYIYSNADRTAFTVGRLWSYVTYGGIGYSSTQVGASIVEVDANRVGIFYSGGSNASGYFFRRMIWNKDGSDSVANASVEAIAGADDPSPSTVIAKNGGGFLAVVAYLNGTTGEWWFRRWNSADFITWDAVGTGFQPSGLTAANKLGHPYLHYQDDGTLFLWFEYLESESSGAELWNCYFMTSADNGATWSAPTKATTYTDYLASGRHPWAVQKGADQQTLVFDEVRGSLSMDDTFTGWPSGDNAGYFQLDTARRRALIANIYGGGGYKTLQNVVEVDIDNWEVTRYWDNTTSPKFDDDVVSSIHSFPRGGKAQSSNPSKILIVTPKTTGSLPMRIFLLDAVANDITRFSYDDYTSQGIVRNLEIPNLYGTTLFNSEIAFVYLDDDLHRLYVYFMETNGFVWGYYDISTVQETYPWTELAHITDPMSAESSALGIMGLSTIHIDKANDRVFFNACQAAEYGWPYVTRIHSLSTGSEIVKLKKSTHATFPKYGLSGMCVVDQYIVASFPYDSDAPSDKGIVIIDTASGYVGTYTRPPYDASDENTFAVMPDRMPDGRVMICGTGDDANDCHGLNIYDPATGEWERFHNSTVPGMVPSPTVDNLHWARFDEISGRFFVGRQWSWTGWTGFIQFSVYGFLKRSYYVTGTVSGGVWTWGTPAPLVIGYQDYNLAVALHPTDLTMYAFWTKRVGTDLLIYWDMENSELDLRPYLDAGSAVEVKRSIDGSPAALSFQVANGHLFDPFNGLSLMSLYLKKFRKLLLEFGETIAGVDYWQECGTFFVTAATLKYERGKMPTLSVKAEDQRIFLKENEMEVTEFYSGLPVAILTAFLQNECGFDLTDIDLPTSFANQVMIYQQWIDTTAWKVLEQVGHRFGYIPRISQLNKANFRRVHNANAADNTYSDLGTVIGFTPDDSYSDLTNRVIVTGQTRDRMTVLYAEEMVGQASGTVGWWGGKKTVRIYYSDDEEKKCMNPRLEILQSVSAFNFKLGGGGESITDEDPNFKWVEITIDVPNLSGVAAGLLVGVVVAAIASYANGLVSYPGFIVFSLLLAALLTIIASIAMYQYQIRAQPVGEERSIVQGTADDLTQQANVGRIIKKSIDDVLCYNSNDCLVVANHELMIVQLQRSRVKFSKAAHLQDEEADTLVLPHPISGLPLSVFVTDLTRRFKIPEKAGAEGSFTDAIEGWKL